MKYDIGSLTFREKVDLLTGKDNWHLNDANGKLKQIILCDGPSGLRKVEIEGQVNVGTSRKVLPATAMPTLSSVANTWDKELAYLDGETIANDCIEKGADVLLAPGVNIKRTPLCGRNFEYFSEDPFLSGTLAKEYIEGVQSKGIGTSLKHYCANNRELDRCFQSSEVDERTLREIYLTAFEIAVKAKPWTVMCSYNPVNGVYAAENKKLLKDILRDEFGFDGLIVSDWTAVHNPYKSVKATLDLNMPYDAKSTDCITKAYEEGLVTMEEIDKCVENVLRLIEKTENDKKTINYTKAERHENAVKIAKDSFVLLKNEGGILPLKTGKICVINQESNYNPRVGGNGSSRVTTEYKQKKLSDLLNENSFGAKFSDTGTAVITDDDIQWEVKKFYQYAYDSDAVIFPVSAFTESRESEGFDRTSIKLSYKTEDAILRVAEFNPNVILLVYAGSAVDLSRVIDSVKAVVWVGFSGEGVNEALAQLLTGRYNFSGKLSETLPLSIEDTPVSLSHGNGAVEWYKEGLFVGYRYYDTFHKPVLFPFGHGLSYSDFVYSNLKIVKDGETDYTVSFDITNDSDVDGKEISQVYVRDVISMVVRPFKELKGFSKDLIKAHQTKTVSVKLNERSFAYYSTVFNKWHVENGTFEILVGASSQDIRLKGRIEIELPDKTQQSNS